MNVYFRLIVYFIFINNFYFASNGIITGYIIDMVTHSPISGANVIIQETKQGTFTDDSGLFYLDNIDFGNYTVTASIIGYKSKSKVNINVSSDRQTYIKFLLETSILKSKDILVSGGYFEKAKDAIVSSHSIDRAEIRSDPVGAYDIQMMTHSLPAVVTDTDQNNEIIVRGGGPGENLFVMDHLDIPNPNHFGFVGKGGGPVNLINTEFVERIDFYAGGFPARYGDKQSSVMDLSLREGNFKNTDYDVEMSMAGLGFLIEGPIVKNKISFISSYRKSFIDNLIESAGLTSVPKYSNTQHKISYLINRKNKIYFNFLGGIDEIDILDENRPDMYGAENVRYEGYQYTYGITYKNLFSSKGYQLFSIGKSSTKWYAEVFKIDEEQEDPPFFIRDNIESDYFLKWDIIYKIKENLELNTGFNIKRGEFKFNEILKPDSVYSYTYNSIPDPSILYDVDNYYDFINNYPDFYEQINDYEIDEFLYAIEGFENFNSGSLMKYAFYNQLRYILGKIELTCGLRYDNIKKNNTSEISPRFGMSYSINPITKINLAIGTFYQTPNYWKLMSPDNQKNLDNSFTKQYIVGLEKFVNEDTRLTLEIYKKEYFKRSVLEADITANDIEDDIDGGFNFLAIGEGFSNGIEFFIQKKFSNNWYGTFSYSYSDSKAKKFRDNENHNEFYTWDFDNRNSLTIVGGYKLIFKDIDWYENLKDRRIFSLLAFMPFMPSDQYEISFRYKLSDGLPFTEKRFFYNVRRWIVDPAIELNSSRENYYARLDIMFMRRFNFKKINVTTFIDIQNVFNRDNEWERVYYEDGTYEMSYQYKQIPVGGFIIEF